ncbi:NAD(P)-dependent oxidoreductase [Actinoallomurus rhizosphaericola]|uniref:NAD(P)-dependent oxidoreductase n=1 Tax=Actinoallomurus rhizosphaericola TaxID=2952536 RepID=UPI0020926269|nr:NAD(P)-binding domain-containing protein [Actinoallomurus rhizosphaericola]MCO6000177.1 NAD(P)-dependent oxidoreductase [Actinoallomurus rhizosphaericola]
MTETSAPHDTPVVGWIGLGDQGLPMARAIAEAAFPLHVWARRPASLGALAGVAYQAAGSVEELAASCDIVALCVGTDEDVEGLVERMLPHLRAHTVVVNHGTGVPATAIRLTERCAERGIAVVDAPVSGGRPAAEEKRLTTMVGGPEDAVQRCRPVFDAFSAHVVHLGGSGSGQTAKLFNNALLMLNQRSVADIVALAARMNLDLGALVEVLKLGSASSAALSLLNTMVRTDNVEHLSKVEALDMELFDRAMRDAGIEAGEVIERGLSGARGLPDLLARLNA